MITYQPCRDLQASAKLTYHNMQMYYEKYAPEWDDVKVYEQISHLENLDILDGDQIVGAIRIFFDSKCCYLRDLQVCAVRQNNGIGAKAIAHVCKLAAQGGANLLALKVFKVSPASRLYVREGFATVNEDERFYYMEKRL